MTCKIKIKQENGEPNHGGKKNTTQQTNITKVI